MFHKINFLKYYLLIFSLILYSCQLREQKNNHGIVFLENRANKLVLYKSNSNDVIKTMGQPHTKSINNDNEWFYFERILSKGKFHKLGKNVLVSNNLLSLKFDKYGVLTSKSLLDKESMNKVNFSNMKTNSQLSQKSFVEKFLSSVKEKMYRNR